MLLWLLGAGTCLPSLSLPSPTQLWWRPLQRCASLFLEAAGSGIPEVKAYLNGVDTPRIFAPKTLLVKVPASSLPVPPCANPAYLSTKDPSCLGACSLPPCASLCQPCLSCQGACHPSPSPSPVTRHPSPVTRHPSPVTRHPSPVTRNSTNRSFTVMVQALEALEAC